MNESFTGNLRVRVHPSVLERGWAGFARHHDAGEWEFHCTLDTLDEPLQTVPLQSLLDSDPSLRQLENLPPMSQAWRWEIGDEFQKSRLPTGPTYFLQVEARPSANHPEHGEIEGAVVNCWVRINSEAAAEELVRRELARQNWLIDSIAGPEMHTTEDYEDDPTDSEYYEQAQTDGDVFVFHVYGDDENA